MVFDLLSNGFVTKKSQDKICSVNLKVIGNLITPNADCTGSGREGLAEGPLAGQMGRGHPGLCRDPPGAPRLAGSRLAIQTSSSPVSAFLSVSSMATLQRIKRKQGRLSYKK